MAFVLLWIENLTASLLLVATLLAYIGQRRRRVLWTTLAVLVPALAYAALCVLSGVLKFYFLVWGVPFYSVLTLGVCFAIGTVWIVRRGVRRDPDDPARPRAADWPRGRLAIALGVVFAMHLMTYWNLDTAVRSRLESYRAEARELALSVAPQRIPDRDNAALVYQQAIEAMGPESVWEAAWNNEWQRWLDGDAPDFDPQDADLREFLRHQAGTLALVRRASTMPDCRFDRDYTRPRYDMVPPEIRAFHDSTRLLSLDARCKATDGDLDGALEDVRAMLAIGEHAAHEPLLISLLVATSIERRAGDTLDAVFAIGQPSAEQLAVLDRGVQASYATRFERCLCMEESLHLTTCCAIGLQWDSDLTGEDDLVFLVGFVSPYGVFMLDRDLAALRFEMRESRRLAHLPYCESKDAWSDYGRRLTMGSRGILVRLLMPVMAAVAEKVAEADARHRLLSLAVAMCRYRAAEGQFPERLDQLMPEWIAAVPVDPFDGQPLKLTEIDGRPVLYSVGPDAADNRGAPMDKENEVGDITFELVGP